MNFSAADIKRLSHLSCLELSEEQVAQMSEQLKNIFTLSEQMLLVDTDGIEPLFHPVMAFEANWALRLRDDVVTEPDHHTEYQLSAPAVQDSMYLVPRVIE